MQGVGCVGGPCLDGAGGQMRDEIGDLLVDARAGRGQGRHVLMHVLEHHGDGIVRRERHVAGEHLPSHDSHGIQVSLHGRLVVLDHFRRQIRGGAEQHAGGRQCRLRRGLRQAEIGDLHVPAVVDQDVLGLDVAVDDAHAVRRCQSVQRLGDDAQHLAHAERALQVHVVTQVHSMHVFHDQIVQPIEFASVIHLHDMWVRDRRGGLGLAVEPFHELLAVRSLRQLHVHDLDGDAAFEPGILRLVHGRHAAFGDFAYDAVSPLYHSSLRLLRRGCDFTHGCIVRFFLLKNGISNTYVGENSTL